jgi:hypothetical protein
VFRRCGIAGRPRPDYEDRIEKWCVSNSRHPKNV